MTDAAAEPSGFSKYLAIDILIVIILIFLGIPLLDPDMETAQGAGNLKFHVDWYDEVSETTRKFILTYFESDGSVEMYDLKHKKLFLNRMPCDTVNKNELFVGSTIVILSRRLFITGFADNDTKEKVENAVESTFAMIKPDGMKNLGLILDSIESEGFTFKQLMLTKLTRNQAQYFYNEHRERKFFQELVDYVTSGPVVAMELVKPKAVVAWRELLGPTDSRQALKEFPNTIRARFGVDKTLNAAHGSDSLESAQRELKFFFQGNTDPEIASPAPIANFIHSTCCVIKPHILKAAKAGKIINNIQKSGYNISGMFLHKLKYEHGEEFYEIYKGIVQDYTGLVQQISSGPSLVLEISHPDYQQDQEIVTKFRDIIGPSDPLTAKKLNADSLRAKFGVSHEENAIHCTDMPDDGPLEVEYFFKILLP